MKIKQYQIDAFASRVFTGNPAAVCPLEDWLPDAVLQAIAEENNLSETAFFVPSEKGFHLRWFTPNAEIDLCGHATLACAHVLFNLLGFPGKSVVFETRSGKLTVEKKGDLLAMDFPAIPPKPCLPPAALIEGLGRPPVEVLAAGDYIAVFEGGDDVLLLTPDFARLNELDLRGVCATAPGRESDFVSRFFA
ncbi:MAG: PhzF family phenazine biosynthesis protein, partial [Gammaproteobacteria bacterium]